MAGLIMAVAAEERDALIYDLVIIDFLFGIVFSMASAVVSSIMLLVLDMLFSVLLLSEKW